MSDQKLQSAFERRLEIMPVVWMLARGAARSLARVLAREARHARDTAKESSKHSGGETRIRRVKAQS